MGLHLLDEIMRPFQQPTKFAKFELVINLKTAKALGVTFPPSLLLPADQRRSPLGAGLGPVKDPRSELDETAAPPARSGGG